MSFPGAFRASRDPRSPPLPIGSGHFTTTYNDEMMTLFGFAEHPIIQAPMAGVQAGALAAAAAAAGVLGSLPTAVFTPETMRKELEGFRAGSHRPINVNFFVHVVVEADAAREAAWRELL